MKISRISLLFISLLLITSNIYSQPVFTFHITGGYSIPLGDFINDVEKSDTTPANWPYLMKNGYNFGADGNFAFGKKKNIRAAFGVNYSSFHDKGDIVNTGDTALITELKIAVNILTVSLGVEYAFTPKEKSSPFLGLDFTANFFSGDFEFFPGSPRDVRTSIKPATRYGIQVNGGVDVLFNKYIGAVFGIKFNWPNLFGKEYTEIGVLQNEVALNDKEHVENGIAKDARNIMYFQPYLGFSFLLGQPKKIIKK
ncbi:MAG: hypothetical protein EHM58_18415 [Ignavibacteriae bacterium]|nr:MAG: hypothetical protein EHM58_18415 [Ignavibacteriota bacterium]